MQSDSQFLLLKSRRFLPLFVTQFLGAFHDNLFKNALVVLMLYSTAAQAGGGTAILTTLASAVFILPFVLFSAMGGQLADKFPKEKIIRVIKTVEIGIAALGAISLLSGSLVLSFITLFALGTHSAFFGPSKYSILPQHLREEELIGGNALLNTGTFLAILLGTVAGTSLIGLSHGAGIVSTMLFLCAGLGWVTSRSIPPAPPKHEGGTFDFNPIRENIEILRYSLTRPEGVTRAIFGISWFYFMGGMFIAQMPNFVRLSLNADQHVLSFFLVTFSIGIAVGGLFNNRLLKGRIEATYAPLAILGITLFAFDLCAASGDTAPSGALTGLGAFLSVPTNWRIVFDVAMISVCGGLFVVPLVAIIQHRTPEDHRARVQAGNAVMNSLFIVASAILSAIMIGLGLSEQTMFRLFAGANALIALYICSLLPDYLFKSVLQGLFRLLYRVEVRGLENVEKAGPRAIIVANHVSFIDPPLLAAFLPGKPMFAVNRYVAEWWWVSPFLKLVDAFPLDPANPFSVKALIRKVQEDRQVVIFPEGRLSDTGSLMKIYDGTGMIADKAEAVILPIRLDGVQHTIFTRLKGKVPRRLFPKITITIMEPQSFKLDDALKGRARRAAAGRQLHYLMEDMIFRTSSRDQTLWQALVQAGHLYGGNTIAIQDIEWKGLPYKRLIQRSMLLGRKLEPLTAPGENVGVLLPSSNGAAVTFFALQAIGRVPAMLNFSTGPKAMISACATTGIKTVLTSRRFVELGRLTEAVDKLAQQTRVIYLEDIRGQVTLANKLGILFAVPSQMPAKNVDPHSPAVILFTSGSEGEPKGVVLSHANLMANIAQLSARIDFNQQDVVLNCLPMFHSIGLTGGTLLPILRGVKTVLYPSPLHYRIVPEFVYGANATIMFGTDTFLQGYARMANPYDFYRMRYIFAGAEKVKDSTRRQYLDTFGVRILEGYGVTESAPGIALNSAIHRKDGTVGRLLPGIEVRLEPVPGVEEGQRLFVKGPNIMLGYYKSDRPGVLQPPEQGWHDTGDIVSIDKEGFITILGRAKRFAKIAGEMVSLAQVEAMAQAVWPQGQHAVIAQPDPRKGEQLVLVTTQDGAARDALSAYAAHHGIASLTVPATILPIEKMAVLGTGKTDYPAIETFVEAQLAKAG
jgi:acyl-[acyl-carrier-protein]-phospholipid O-acyltransferase/long-chain-fatty-acid--[acyl-carrier-protein] ligase